MQQLFIFPLSVSLLASAHAVYLLKLCFVETLDGYCIVICMSYASQWSSALALKAMVW